MSLIVKHWQEIAQLITALQANGGRLSYSAAAEILPQPPINWQSWLTPLNHSPIDIECNNKEILLKSLPELLSQANFPNASCPVEAHWALESTHRYALALKNIPENGLTIVADCQIAGQGRNLKTWQTLPAAGIYLSHLNAKNTQQPNLALVSLRVGLMLAELLILNTTLVSV